MEHENEVSICGFCGCDICCPDGFKEHFISDHYDIIKKYAQELGITTKEWMQIADEKLGTKF
jgi:hypothetical protein